MKKYVVIFLLFVLSNAVFKDLVSYTYFVANQDYIIENYCINTNKPEVMCSGKCYLDTMIEQNHSDADKLTFSVDDHHMLKYVSVPELQDFDFFYNKPIHKHKENFPIQQEKLMDYFSEIFHPPTSFV